MSFKTHQSPYLPSVEPHSRDALSSSGRTLAQLRARTIERARCEPSLTRAQVAVRHRTATVAVLLVPLLVFIGLGGVRVAPRPAGLVLETVLGSSSLAIGAAIIGVRRGRSMLGRPRSRLVAVALFTPVLLLVWRVLASSRYPSMMTEWPERPGLRCLLLSGALSFVPLLGLLWMRRASDPVHPRATAAALGTAAGASAWVLVDLWCPVGYLPHLLLGHVLPLFLTILASIAFGSRIVLLHFR